MRIAAYQFNVSGDIHQNLAVVEKAVIEAAGREVQLIIFPECALTGYPPRSVADSNAVDIEEVSAGLQKLQSLADEYKICIIIGAVAFDKNYYNRACVLQPGQPMDWYDKRALYGWDAENFCLGQRDGVFRIGDLTAGIRICYEVRFPEYFRELYLAKTDLNIVLFSDVSDEENVNRYETIRSHLITRAVENVTPILSVNESASYQTAPTAFFDASGKVLCEHERNKEGMIIYDFEKKELNFGEIGRKLESDKLLGISSNK